MTDADGAVVAAALEALVAAVAQNAKEEEEEEEEVVRLAASKVALLVGLHEFGDVGDAVLEYVYQGRDELLAQDAEALGLRIVSKDDELQELVDKTGAALAPQLQEILTWTRERERRPATQADAAVLLQNVDRLVSQAHGKRKLQTEEADEVKRQLRERIRLSYGCRNEDLALKTYEQQTGSSVRLSNQEFYVLEFPRIGTPDADFAAIERSIERRIAVPGTHRHQEKKDRSPYFTICGMIDGVADSLTIADDDEWALVPILLEVKNRLRAFRVPPPLYDYIQMAVYLKMVGLTSGDLIQCLHSDRAQIHVTRVALDAHPLRRDRGLWASVLLPRLYTMVHTIEQLRTNDLLRLAYLNGSNAERLEILRRECDFL